MTQRKFASVAERRAARRRLFEEFGVPLDLMAVACGLQPVSVRGQAAREDWKETLRSGSTDEREAAIAAMLDEMLAELEALPKDDETGRYDKRRIDALSARMRMLEKLAEINETRRARGEEQKKTDADIAEILSRIDERIVELAREFARELVGDDVRDAAGDAADRGRVVA